MVRIGLTGNVAAGKSSVAEVWRGLGAAVIDADLIARDVVAPGTPGLQRILARFGTTVARPDGSLDRGALRRLVLHDPGARADLNAIVHPLVAERSADQEQAARERGAACVVHDIPLLFEVLDPATFDAIVLVDAPEALRRERLVRDRGLTPAEADALIAAQMPAAAKRPQATAIIENTGSREELTASALAVWRELQSRAAAP